MSLGLGSLMVGMSYIHIGRTIRRSTEVLVLWTVTLSHGDLFVSRKRGIPSIQRRESSPSLLKTIIGRHYQNCLELASLGSDGTFMIIQITSLLVQKSNFRLSNNHSLRQVDLHLQPCTMEAISDRLLFFVVVSSFDFAFHLSLQRKSQNENPKK